MRHVYSDESTFSDPRLCIGVGMLLSDSDISAALITNAMNALREDPDRFEGRSKTIDDRTIERGYFHASEDSKNAHSHLCNQINTLNNVRNEPNLLAF